jgi:hypothetical protein
MRHRARFRLRQGRVYRRPAPQSAAAGAAGGSARAGRSCARPRLLGLSRGGRDHAQSP